MNIIFYSRNCESSHNLMMLMKNIGILDKFKIYCVDDNLDAVPPHIKNVPTLITNIKGNTHIMEFDEAVKWIQSIRYFKQCHIADQQKKMILMNMMKQAQMQGPHGYSQGEMNGISDTFAYTDIDMAQPHSFCNYGDENAIFTAPEEKNKITKAEQNQKIAEYKAILEKQNENILFAAKKEQLNQIFAMEQQKIAEQNGNI